MKRVGHIAADPGSQWMTALCIVLAVIASRLFFLPWVPGPDPDAWKLVILSRQLALSGIYEVSRFPGYPVVELLFSILARAPFWAYSALSLGVSAFGAGALYLLLAPLIRHSVLIVIGIYLTPVLIIESISGMDYMFALSFAILSAYALTRQLLVTAGVCLGLAIASRVTSVLFWPGLLLMLLCVSHESSKLRALSVFSLCATAVAAAFYLLPFSVYGWSFIRFYDVDYPPVSVAIFRATSAFGGTIPTLIFLLAFCFAIVFSVRKRGSYTGTQIGLSWMALCTAVLFSALFARAPFEAAYLLPVILSVFVFLALWLSRIIVLTLIAFAIAAGIFDVIPPSKGVGIALQIHDLKQTRLARARDLSSFRAQMGDSDILVTGHMHPVVIAMKPGRFADDRIVYSIDAKVAAKVASSGGQIFYPQEMKTFLEAKEDVSLDAFNANPIP